MFAHLAGKFAGKMASEAPKKAPPGGQKWELKTCYNQTWN